MTTTTLGQAEIKRHLDNDQCGPNPSCGSQRVLFTYWREPTACCPRCYKAVFAVEPEQGMTIVTIAPSAPFGELLATDTSIDL